MSVWIFQALAEEYLLADKVPELLGKTDDWTAGTGKNPKKLAPHALVLLWQAGPQAGIYALGSIAGEPFEKDGEWRVNIRYDQLLKRPIFRADLKAHPILQNLAILRAYGGTIFRVTDEQWEVLEKMLPAQ